MVKDTQTIKFYGENKMVSNYPKHTAKIGDALQGDEWKLWQTLDKGDSFTDSSYSGCQFRYGCGFYNSDTQKWDANIGVNIVVTGKPHFTGWGDRLKSRIKIEVVGDGCPSTFFGGWLFHDLDKSLQGGR